MKKWKISKVISWILVVALTHTFVNASEVKATSIAVGAGIGGTIAGPPGALVGAMVGGAIVGTAAAGGVMLYKEHQKKGTTNPAKENKHEKGEATRQRNKFGGEKGDARRQPNPNKRNK